MSTDAFLGFLLATAVCALLAFLAALLLRTRLSVLGSIGTGLLGQGIGSWIAGLVHGMAWPYFLTLTTTGVHLLWTFLGALLVLLIVRYTPRAGKARPAS